MREKSIFQERNNPLAELISDEIFDLLSECRLINEKSLRDYTMRKKFQDLRDNAISASDAIDKIRAQYPYLQYDTIRKIVYNINK